MTLPLEDVCIIAIEQYGAGPYGTSHLAQMGAKIIKIEDPTQGGDVGRGVEPYAEDGDSLFFETFNAGKSSIMLDIRTEAGRRVFEDLIRHADAVYSNLRGDVPQKLGITYETLGKINPRIVCCSLSAFGMTGPLSREPGYDSVLQAYSGWMTINGEPGSIPQKTGLSLVDFASGFVAALAMMSGIHAARRDGKGMDCDLSLYDTAVNLLTYLATWHLTSGYEPVRRARSAHPSRVPFQVFPAGDGWMVVGANKDKFWDRLVDVLDEPVLRDDPRFQTFASRFEHREELQDVMDRVLARRTVEEWLEDLRAAGVPCAPVLDMPDALAHEHVDARELIMESEHPRFGTVRQIRSPVRVGTSHPEQVGRAPFRGENTSSVLTEMLGYSPEEIEECRSAGAFGATDG